MPSLIVELTWSGNINPFLKNPFRKDFFKIVHGRIDILNPDQRLRKAP